MTRRTARRTAPSDGTRTSFKVGCREAQSGRRRAFPKSRQPRDAPHVRGSARARPGAGARAGRALNAASLVSRSGRRRAAADNDIQIRLRRAATNADLYYINLQRRPDRNAALLRQLDRVGYDRAHVHRINATAHADGAAGCLLSRVARWRRSSRARRRRRRRRRPARRARPRGRLRVVRRGGGARAAARRLRAAGQLAVILLACRGVPAPLRDGALAGRYESAAGVLHHLGLQRFAPRTRRSSSSASGAPTARAAPRRKHLALLGRRR